MSGKSCLSYYSLSKNKSIYDTGEGKSMRTSLMTKNGRGERAIQTVAFGVLFFMTTLIGIKWDAKI